MNIEDMIFGSEEVKTIRLTLGKAEEITNYQDGFLKFCFNKKPSDKYIIIKIDSYYSEDTSSGFLPVIRGIVDQFNVIFNNNYENLFNQLSRKNLSNNEIIRVLREIAETLDDDKKVIIILPLLDTFSFQDNYERHLNWLADFSNLLDNVYFSKGIIRNIKNWKIILPMSDFLSNKISLNSYLNERFPSIMFKNPVK